MDDDYTEDEFLERAESFTRKQVFRRRPKSAGSVINTLLARKGYNQVESNDELQRVWESVIDPRMKNNTVATAIKAGRLEVIVANAVVNQELTFNKSNLLAKLKDSSIGKRIKDIRFRIGVV